MHKIFEERLLIETDIYVPTSKVKNISFCGERSLNNIDIYVDLFLLLSVFTILTQ